MESTPPLLKLLAVLLSITSLGIRSSWCAILSKSNIEKCDRTTSKDLKCSQKIVVQLAVAAGKSAEEDEITATIDTVSNGTFTQSLQDPQIIRISKSSVGYAYPLEYLQNFNRQPYEEYRRVDECKPEQCWDGNPPQSNKKIYWGICCLCGGDSHHRGVNAKCGASKLDYGHIGRKGTRHCLKWHPQWFPTFIIGLATMEFNIYVDISIGYGNSARGINASEWLIIDRHKYTESGAVCDLIGSSYEAFTLVNVPCTRSVGYCLSYQLGDYIKAHNIEILLIPLNQTQNSIVVLELSADNLEFIVSRSPGKIISVKSSKFAALSHDGYSDVTVVNTGELVAAFTLGVDCPVGIQASPAVTMSLRPNEPKTQHFELNAESSTSQTFNCSVRLRDSEGEVADVIDAYVSVTATQFTNVSKIQSEGVSMKGERVRNGGGILGFVGNALGGVFSFTKSIAGNLAGAFAKLGISLISSIFGPNIGALIEGFVHGISSLMNWILGGFGIGSLFGSGQCNCAGDFDVLCILANFCFSKMIGLLGFLLVLVGVVMSVVSLHRMGLLGPLGRCMGRCCLFPLRGCKKKDGENRGRDEEEDDNVQPNAKPYRNPPQLMPIPAQHMAPWTMMPSASPYGYGYQ
ncbi:hypothetical protein GOP47_0006247 [Adiantum capillus-veneris]|uniref:Generative cell specific-1/HAP2 domain-containing protein n=1 Tax=Adiantum capillus-veneris TaxID=13818 RepID=A0A9D4V376_ADICA|nr:hypothetical protein GOP47_0006247 [Adiantum capillus-veneris]